jgi:hypothetical protein
VKTVAPKVWSNATDIGVFEVVVLEGALAFELVLYQRGLARLSGPHNGDDPFGL